MMFRALLVAAIGWPAWAQPPALAALADHWADHYRVPRELVHAVIEAESNWKATAVSSAGAVGLMQLMPDTAVAFRVTNRFDPSENLRGGVAYLAFLLRSFGGDRRLAVASYHAGHGRLMKARFQYQNPQTLSYTHRVAHLYRRNRWESILKTRKELVE